MILKHRMITLECLINKIKTDNKKCVAESSVHRTSWIKWRTMYSKKWPTDKDLKKRCLPSIITREKWDSGSLKKRGQREWDRSKKKCDSSSPSRLKRKRRGRTMRSPTSTIKPKCGRLTRTIGKKKINDLRWGFRRLIKITRTTCWNKWRTKIRRINSKEALWTSMISWWISHCSEKSTRN